MALQPEWGVGCLGFLVSRSHTIRETQTENRRVSCESAVSSSQRPLPTQHPKNTNDKIAFSKPNFKPRTHQIISLKPTLLDCSAAVIGLFILYYTMLHYIILLPYNWSSCFKMYPSHYEIKVPTCLREFLLQT